MSLYHFDLSPSSQVSGNGLLLPAHSIGQDFCVPSSLQTSTLEYQPTAFQQSYSLLGQDVDGTVQAPRIPGTHSVRSIHSSAGSGSVRTPSLSSHPYHQARLCYTTDRTSAQHEEWSRLAFSTFPTPAPASDAVTPHTAVSGNRASSHCHSSNQLPLASLKLALAPTISLASQSNIVAPNTNENISLSTGSLTIPKRTLLSTNETRTSLPHTLADEADIEYAQHRYGDKRCFYQCRFDLLGSPCNKWIVGDRTRVLRHLRSHHHLQTGPAAPASCRWDECTHSRPMKQENLSRHVVMHLGVKWRCLHCRRLFSRDDAVHRHIERMVPGMDVTDAEVVPGRNARAITEPQSKRARIA